MPAVREDGVAYLISGSSGFVGNALCQKLAEHDEVYALYHATPPEFSCRTNIHPISLAGIGELLPADTIDTVIHCAALHPHSPHQLTGSEQYLRVNCDLTQQMAEIANAHAVRHFLYMSTIAVYGDAKCGCLDEGSPLYHPGPYGASKYLGELIVREVSTAPLRLILRMPGIVGASSRYPWLCRVKEKALQHQPITIHNSDARFNNVTDTDEIAKFILHILGSAGPECDVVNFGASEPVSILEAVMEIIASTGSRSTVEDLGPTGQSFYISTKKLSEKYGFTPQKTLDCIARYAAE